MNAPAKEQLIRKAGDPKVLPSVARKVLELVGSDSTSNVELCRVIERDQTISASILKIANSAFYGLRQEVTSLNQAIVILGFNALKDLVITISTKLQYKKFGITEQMMWDHSIGAAIAARHIVEGRGRDLEEIAFLGGLMHDFGKVVMNNEAPEVFLEVMQEIYNDGCEPIEAEQRTFGYTHSEIGSSVLREWGFPSVLADILDYHHLDTCTLDDIKDPFVAKAVASINLANSICKVLGIGYRSANETLEPSKLSSAQMLSLSDEELKKLCSAVHDSFQAEKSSFQ